MPTLDLSTGFVDGGGTPAWRAHHAPPTARAARYRLGRLVFVLIMLPLLAASVVAAAWSCWVLAAGALDGQGAVLAVVALVAGAAGFSRHTGQSFAGTLILIGFGGLTLLFGVLFGVAGYTLIFGG